MNIIVCIKQVPETTEIKINPQTNTLIREGVESIINPYDQYALEEALRLKEKMGGDTTVITMGPPQAEKALREALSLGIDQAILLSDPLFAGADTLSTSFTLAKGINKIAKYDLIICGKQASDGDTAQVGPGLAEFLGIPFVAYVRKIRQITDTSLQVERMMEEGFEAIELSLPALITVVKEINEPRLPSLKGMLRARKAALTKWGVKELGVSEEAVGLKGSPTKVVRIFTPPLREKGEMIPGLPREQAARLVEKFRQEKLL